MTLLSSGKRGLPRDFVALGKENIESKLRQEVPSVFDGIEVSVRGIRLFGSRARPFVSLIVDNPALVVQRSRLIETLDTLSPSFADYSSSDFNPHVSIAQVDSRATANQIVGELRPVLPGTLALSGIRIVLHNPE
ncbi:MAG: 2'-5' RNA ligase family protein [Candidatus Saccharimonadales bacterium]